MNRIPPAQIETAASAPLIPQSASGAIGIIRRMKAPAASMLVLLAGATRLVASTEDMPFITARIETDQKRVAADVTAGTISQDDADKLNARLAHVRSVVDSESRMTRETRRIMRQDMDNIEKDIANKEQAKSGTAAPTP